jgi:hypothetical protein
MLNETFLVNRIKEQTSFISMDINTALKQCQAHPHDQRYNEILKFYVLPDGAQEKMGRIKVLLFFKFT